MADGSCLASSARGPAPREPAFPLPPWLPGACALADLDQVTVGIADVATDLGSAVLRRRQELSPASAPVGVHRLYVCDADVEEAARPVRVRRCLERDGRLVLGGSAADVDDHPAVRERDNRRLALEDGLAAEHLGIETA